MLEMIGILVGTTILAVLKPTAAQAHRFEGRPPPHPSPHR